MERLCKLYKSPCALSYQQAWTKAERNPPSMPYVGDLLMKLLGFGSLERRPECNNNLLPAKDRTFQQQPALANPSGKVQNSSDLKCNQDLEQKPSVGKRILTVLTRMRHRKDPGTIQEEQELPWTSREQDLAWKYFYHWRNVILKRRAVVKEQERLRDMDPRMKRVLEVVSWLADCQKEAQGYDFPRHSFTREFLLKTRYREDKENFFISLMLEPSKIT